MHPDYLDYVGEKRKIHSRAKWTDVKFLLRKVMGLELDKAYVKPVNHNDWNGWLVEFACDVDLAELKRQVSFVLVLGERAVFIGVKNG